jgi:hypothetical protein
MVGVSHGQVQRVRELLEKRPTLANAAWDWGFGDWETALGAASHVGNREIALLLLASGARPTIFSAAMLGQIEVVRAFVSVSPGVQKTRGPHGIPLLAHARAGGPGAAEVVKYLEAVGDANPAYRNEPLTEAAKASLSGIYAFGPGPTDRFEVVVAAQGLTIKRTGGSARNLVHQGSFAFLPVGAEGVRIRFEVVGDRATSVTVQDADLLLTATRV